jgi:SIR2-like domain
MNKQRRPRRRVAQASLQSLFPDFRLRKFRESSLQRRDANIRELHEAYLHRGLVLYVGAGVSLSLGLPSWPELIRALSVTMMSRRVETAIDTLKDLPEEQKWERLSTLQVQVEKRADSDKPILLMARAVKDELRERLPSAIARTLYRPVFRALWAYGREEDDHRSKKYRPAVLHRRPLLPSSDLLDAIVALARAERDVQGVQAIVNYNFDDLLDEKLREQHVKCRTVLSGRDVVPQGTLPSYHVHGLISSREFGRRRRVARAQGNLVFSEDEYHAEYSDPYRWSNMTQMSLLGRYTGLFVGLSLEDPNIRRLIDVTHRQYPENLNYAILPRKRPLGDVRDNNDTVMKNLFEEVESNSFDRIGVRVIWVDSHEEIPRLLKRVCGAEAD